MSFTIQEFYPCRWHVINELGQPVYDDARDGNDRPIIFTDEDAARDCARRLNEGEDI